MGRLIHLCWIPLALIALPLIVLYYLAFTASGLARLASTLNRRIGPVSIQIRGASGTLAHGVHIDLLVIEHRRVHIEVEDVSATLAILPLAWQTIRVPQAHAARLLIRALPRTEKSNDWRPHFLPPLMRIQAEHVEVQRGQLITTSGEEYDTRSLSSSGTVYPMSIRIYSGAFDYNGVHVRTNGEVLAASSIGLRGSLHIDAQPSNQPAWTVNARIDGNLAQLDIGADVSEPFTADFGGSAFDLTGRWHWQGRSRLRRLQLSAWRISDGLGDVSGTLALQGDRSGFHAQGTLLAPGLKAGALLTDFSGSYRARVLTVSHLQLQHVESGAIAEAQGSVTVAPGGPRLDLHGDWTQFRWPLAAAAAPVHSQRGQYTLSGVLPFALTAAGDLSAADLQPLQISMRGRLARDAVVADSADVAAFGGHLQLAGELRWSKTPGWQLQGRVTDLDLTQLRPNIDGRLSFAVNADGRGLHASDEFELNVTDLTGNVRGQRAAGHAQIAHRPGDWILSDVRLQLGATRIEADGHAGQALDLNFSIDAADLGLLKSGALGRFTAHGSVRGEARDLTLLTTASGRDIDWAGVHLAALDANIAFDPHGSGRADSTLQLQGLQVGERRLDQLTLSTQGTTTQHSFAVEARAQATQLSLHGSAHYAVGQWQGQIASAVLTDKSRLHMSLETPTQLLLSVGRLHLDQTCLHDEQARLCAAAAIDPQQRALELRATDMPMRALTAGLTAATEYQGTLSIAVNAAALGDAPLRGNLKAQLANAAIRKQFENGRVERLDLGNGVVEAELSEHEFSGTLALDAGVAGNIAGSISGRGSNQAWRDWPLTGQLKIETDAVGFLDSWVSQIDRASGRLSAQLTLAGTAAQPQLAGELKISDGQLDAYQINLSLRDLNFNAHLADTTLMFAGSANAGPDGHASVSGNLRWMKGLPYGDLHLQGTDMRLLNLPEARIDASPDVTVHIEGLRIDVHGQVMLPYARIEPADLANAVLPSSDEIIVGEHPVAPDTQFKIASDIALVLGERVTVRTQGLSGRLSGKLTVTTDDSGINRGSGELTVEEGKYLAYGRNLDIEHGRLLFSSGLLGDPALDLRAIKKFPDITAGVNVRGTLRSPRMTFFSDPEVAQSQIVSLLLAGGSLESVQNSTDPNERANAGRSDLLLQGGAILAQQIGGRYDIEAGVEQDLTNETSLVLGRYLSPRLYVSYGIGLAEALNTIKMRYTIGDRWTIKTEAGTQRSADMVFTIEK